MALRFGTGQFSAMLFSGMGGAMAGLAAGIGAKSCFPEMTSGGRALGGLVIGALIGTVSALVPAMLLYGNALSEGETTVEGTRRLGRVMPQRTFRYTL